MRKYCHIRYLWINLEILGILLFVYSCANRGYPEGGPKDTTPPKVIKEEPVSYTSNFNQKRVAIYFDEFVQLKDVNEKFIISPPQKKKPKPRLKGRYIQVDFLDTLRPNTTYSLDFADAITDNNEGNPLGFYRYVFSTGNVIDSLELSGNVIHAESGEPMLNMYVFLYENHGDSIPIAQLPDYVARTDSSGFFRLTNLRDTSYRLLAVDDANRDYKFTPEAEMVGFLDTIVHPVVMPMTRMDTLVYIDTIVGQDTIRLDSIVQNDYLAYGPNNLQIRLFQEELTQLYMVNDERKEREKMEFIFSIPGENGFKIRLWDTLSKNPLPEDWYLMEHSAGNDTIDIWIKDSSVYKQDTLYFILDYLRSDSLGRHVAYSDTSRYLAKVKKKSEQNKKKKKEEEVKPEFLTINTNASGDFDLNGRISMDFDRPIRKEGLQNIKLLEKVDTLYQPIEFKIVEDSLKIRKFYLDAPLVTEKEYMIQVDSAVIYDIYGRHNDKIEKKFKIRSPEYYGNIMLDVKGVHGNVILQLFKSDGGKSENGKRKFDIVAEKVVKENGVVTFDYLHEGKYQFRAILDENGNGKWDTGLYLGHRQPEMILYLPVEISVKQNFDIEQEFDLQEAYK